MANLTAAQIQAMAFLATANRPAMVKVRTARPLYRNGYVNVWATENGKFVPGGEDSMQRDANAGGWTYASLTDKGRTFIDNAR